VYISRKIKGVVPGAKIFRAPSPSRRQGFKNCFGGKNCDSSVQVISSGLRSGSDSPSSGNLAARIPTASWLGPRYRPLNVTEMAPVWFGGFSSGSDERREVELVGQTRCDALPRGDERGDGRGGAWGAVGDEGRDARGHGAEPDAPRVDGAPAAAAERPERVLAHGGAVEDAPAGVHEDGVEHVVGGEAVLPREQTEPAAGDVPAGAHRRARPRRERERRRARGGHGAVHLPETRAGLHPRRARGGVHADARQRGEVDHRERCAVVVVGGGGVRQALVAVPAAAEPHREPRRARAPHGARPATPGRTPPPAPAPANRRFWMETRSAASYAGDCRVVTFRTPASARHAVNNKQLASSSPVVPACTTPKIRWSATENNSARAAFFMVQTRRRSRALEDTGTVCWKKSDELRAGFYTRAYLPTYVCDDRSTRFLLLRD
jgi:hypothetical protein